MLPSPPPVSVQPKTYWQLAAIALLLFGGLFLWRAICDENQLFTVEVSEERSLFTGMMYRIEYDQQIEGKALARFHRVRLQDLLYVGRSHGQRRRCDPLP